jgi:regulatory protein
MRRNTKRKPRPPLNRDTLDALALFYVGRFATTRARLKSYLERKLRERGWDGPQSPDVDGITERCADRGYVDDAAFALSKSRSLTSRGYGQRRVEQSLRSAGVEEADSDAARQFARLDCVGAALRFAERRRIGPFASQAPDHKMRERALAAMIRAGHGFGLARAIVDLPPGSEVDLTTLAEHSE